MTTTELNKRITDAEQKVISKANTIDKKLASIEKKKEKLIFLGADPSTDRYTYKQDPKWNEIYWLFCDIDTLEDDVIRLNKQIVEIGNTIEKYKKQLSGEAERESVFIKDIPESMKQLQVELVNTWNEYDIKQRNFLNQKYKELGYKEFFNKYPNVSYDKLQKSDNQIKKINETTAKELIIDLYYRVNKITGEVTDWSNIHCSEKALDGIVVGKEGIAKVETILAGGYNIQRLHIRVLVHSI